MTSVAYVEWPDGLMPDTPDWTQITTDLQGLAPDVLVTNEMPFGAWRAWGKKFDRAEAEAWARENEIGLEALAALGIGTVLASRPILKGERLYNEAFVLHDGRYGPLHRKTRFPDENGWREADWFAPGDAAPSVVEVSAGARTLKVGVMLCTEAMFPEYARALGKAGADLIAVPRASGTATEGWRAACSIAAFLAGAFVVSSNRVGKADMRSPRFGGAGLAFEPDASALHPTSEGAPAATIEIDLAATRAAKATYPRYLDAEVRVSTRP